MRLTHLLLVVAILAATLPVVGLQAEEEAAPPSTTIADLAWLVGTWRNEGGQMPFEEVWTAPWGGTMTAVSRGLQDGRTSMVELSCIEPESHDGTLQLHLRHFHRGLKPWASEKDALVWTLSASTKNRVVFTNDARPFPRDVIYERDGDTLHATLAGTQAGTEARMGFELKRVVSE